MGQLSNALIMFEESNLEQTEILIKNGVSKSRGYSALQQEPSFFRAPTINQGEQLRIFRGFDVNKSFGENDDRGPSTLFNVEC